MSPDLEVLVAPSRVFARCAADDAPATIWIAIRRPALVALVLGATAAIAATDHVDARLLLSTTFCWSFVPALQLALAAALIAARPRPTIAWRRLIDLAFLSHTPWSLWLLGYSAWEMLTPVWTRPTNILIWIAPLPAIWTSAILVSYCRDVLRRSTRAALVGTAAHQTATWGLVLLYIGWAVQLWPRLIGFWRT